MNKRNKYIKHNNKNIVFVHDGIMAWIQSEHSYCFSTIQQVIYNNNSDLYYTTDASCSSTIVSIHIIIVIKILSISPYIHNTFYFF